MIVVENVWPHSNGSNVEMKNICSKSLEKSNSELELIPSPKSQDFFDDFENLFNHKDFAFQEDPFMNGFDF